MLFNDYFENSYAEIASYYPRIYADVKEMQAVLQSEGELVDGVKSGIERVFNNCFVDTADSISLSEYEKILGLDSKGMTLDERRRAVKARLVSTGRLSAKMIDEMIRQYTGRETECLLVKPEELAPYEELLIMSDIDESRLIDIEQIKELIDERLPAHIAHKFSPAMPESIEISTEIEAYEFGLPQAGRYFCGQQILF